MTEADVIRRMQDYQEMFSVVRLVDLSTDTQFGHPAGDTAPKAVASAAGFSYRGAFMQARRPCFSSGTRSKEPSARRPLHWFC